MEQRPLLATYPQIIGAHARDREEQRDGDPDVDLRPGLPIVVEHGARRPAADDPHIGGTETQDVRQEEAVERRNSDLGPGGAARIIKACAAKEPESQFHRAERLDPDFADHVRAEVKCLNDHGIRAIVQDGAPALVDGLPGSGKGHWLEDCDHKAFASYYSTLN